MLTTCILISKLRIDIYQPQQKITHLCSGKWCSSLGSGRPVNAAHLSKCQNTERRTLFGHRKVLVYAVFVLQGFLSVLVAVVVVAVVVVVGGGAAGGGGGGGGHLVICWRFKLFKSGWWINILGPSTTNFVQISMVPDLLSINIWGLKTFWSLLHPSWIPKMKNFYWRFDKSPHLETPLAMIQLRIGP